jgi:hypothetical protein
MKRLRRFDFYLLVLFILLISCNELVGNTSCGLISNGLLLRRRYSDQELLKLGFFVDFENSDNHTMRFTKVLNRTLENKDLNILIDLDILGNGELVHCSVITYLEGINVVSEETAVILEAWGSRNLFSQAKLEYIQSAGDFYYIKYSWT